jgi:hypothetical protein
MWFYPVLIVLVILAIVGGTVAGGVYTLVLIPLAVIVAVSVVLYGMWGRSMEARSGGSTEATAQSTEPLPHQETRPSGRAPSSPEALADARRQQQ